MSEKTNIEWCDSTFNPWMGCTKVSPACDHCYAERDTSRFKTVVWGAGQERKRTSAANWKLPIKWNAEPFYQCECGWRGHDVSTAGTDITDGMPSCPVCDSLDLKDARRRVFCASLADVFDNEVPEQWRYDLWQLIHATPNLDWLLLTKRIGNAKQPEVYRNLSWPRNVWLGATICNQKEADRDISKLLEIPASIRFLSIEPLLGQIDIAKWLDPWTCAMCGYHGAEADSGPCLCGVCDIEAVFDPKLGSAKCPACNKNDGQSDDVGNSCPKCRAVGEWSRDYGHKFANDDHFIDWVIVGGESGPSARPMHPQWVRDIRDQCHAAGVPFLFKQWGEWVDGNNVTKEAENKIWFDKGRSVQEMRDLDLLRDFTPAYPPGKPYFGCSYVIKVGKKAAGRLLDGRTHDGYPGEVHE